MMVHQGFKYHCDYCAKHLSSKKGHQYHLLVHTGQYRFKCDICSEGFNEEPKFDKHVQTRN